MPRAAAQGGTAQQLATSMAQECVGVRVGALHRLVSRRFDQALRPLDLSISQMEILSALTLSPEPVKPATVADWLAIERSTMSRNLALLVAKDWVETVKTSPTGRSQTVTITPAGTRALASAQQVWQEVQASVTCQIGADAPATLDTWIGALRP